MIGKVMERKNSNMTVMVLFFLLINCLYAEENSVTQWTDPNTKIKYDFTALKRNPNDPWKIKDGADNGLFSMIYYFNFGVNHNKECKNTKVAVSEVLEILQQTTDTCEILGRIDSATFGLIDNNKPNLGIFVQYGNGDKCTNSDDSYQNGNPRQTRFNLYCSKQQSEFILDLPGGTQGSTKCLLTFKINSPAGCPGGSYTGFRSNLILFWIVFGLIMYFMIGIVYNVKSNNLSGVEAIPNKDFWVGFPYYVKDGVVYSCGIFQRTAVWIKTKMYGESTASYSDI